MLQRFDAREIGDLCSDDDVQVSRIDLLTNPNLQAMLDDASGEIEVSLMAGNRYTAADLAALTGNSAKFLVRICCDIAFYNLLCRRPLGKTEERKTYAEIAREHLKMLKSGDEIFDIEAIKAAGIASVSGLTSAEYDQLNLIRDRTRNTYPSRRLPDNR